jgi:predicted MFS family arabinose efflux permease
LWWIYVVGFVNSTLSIAFNAAEFAAIPSLVTADDLVEANGRIQASYAAATIAGPIAAGLLAGLVAIETVILIDALSFLASAMSLGLISRRFNAADAPGATSIRSDVVEGLRYVLRHPVLRAISLMMALFNFVGAPMMDQLVLFADERLGAGESGVGLLYGAASVGIVVLSLLAGRMRRRWRFSVVALGALLLHGALVMAFALNTSFAVALPLMALLSGLGIMFNINTSSLRQTIVPSHLLGRVMSIAMVLATSASPLGSVIGGVLIERTGHVEAVFAGMGVLMIMIALGFTFTALGRAERYLPGGDLADPDSTDTASRRRVAAEAGR